VGGDDGFGVGVAGDDEGTGHDEPVGKGVGVAVTLGVGVAVGVGVGAGVDTGLNAVGPFGVPFPVGPSYPFTAVQRYAASPCELEGSRLRDEEKDVATFVKDCHDGC
jgi:hypothetical protein